jgi:hypothetical protein
VVPAVASLTETRVGLFVGEMLNFFFGFRSDGDLGGVAVVGVSASAASPRKSLRLESEAAVFLAGDTTSDDWIALSGFFFLSFLVAGVRLDALR